MTLPDGRSVVGMLQCADKQGNLVLHDSTEYLPGRRARRATAPPRPRPLTLLLHSGAARKIGLVLVLRAHRMKVEALKDRAEAAAHAAAGGEPL